MQNSASARKIVIASILLVLMEAFAFQSKEPVVYFSIKNDLNITRNSETVSIPVVKVEKLIKTYGATHLQVKDVATNQALVSQLLDNNGDGVTDEILFQTNIAASAEKKFSVFG